MFVVLDRNRVQLMEHTRAYKPNREEYVNKMSKSIKQRQTKHTRKVSDCLKTFIILDRSRILSSWWRTQEHIRYTPNRKEHEKK